MMINDLLVFNHFKMCTLVRVRHYVKIFDEKRLLCVGNLIGRSFKYKTSNIMESLKLFYQVLCTVHVLSSIEVGVPEQYRESTLFLAGILCNLRM